MTRTVPVAATQAPGNFITSALWNAGVKGLSDYITAVPRFKGYSLSAQAITTGGSGSPNAVALDSSLLDSDGGHSNTTNNSRYVAQVAGLYLVIGTAPFVANTTGYRGAAIDVNGAQPNSSAVQSPGGSVSVTWVVQVSIVAPLNVGDYVELQAWQNSGANLALQSTTAFCPSMSVYWLSM